MILLHRHVLNILRYCVHSLPILDPENPETSRAMAYNISRRAGFKVRTHKDKDAKGIYWIMRLFDDPKSLSEVFGDNDDNK